MMSIPLSAICHRITMKKSFSKYPHNIGSTLGNRTFKNIRLKKWIILHSMTKTMMFFTRIQVFSTQGAISILNMYYMYHSL